MHKVCGLLQHVAVQRLRRRLELHLVTTHARVSGGERDQVERGWGRSGGRCSSGRRTGVPKHRFSKISKWWYTTGTSQV